MQKILVKIRCYERVLLNIVKKVNFLFFLLNPVPFNGQEYEKQKGPGSSDWSLFRLQSKFRKILLLVMYRLTKFDDVIYRGFELFQKLHLLIYARQFMT